MAPQPPDPYGYRSDEDYYNEGGGLYPTEDELIRQLSMLDPSLPGKTASQRLNYLQDLEQSLGYSIIQGYGTGAGDPPPAPPTFNSLNRQVYGGDPLYSQAFDMIDQGADPRSVLSEAQKINPAYFGVDDYGNPTADAAAFEKAVQDYAFEKAKFSQESAASQASGEGAWVRPDGSKYKQTPLGGNDIFGFASEYELNGAPGVEDAVNYARQKRANSNAGRMPEPPRGGGRQGSPSARAPLTGPEGSRRKDTRVPQGSGRALSSGYEDRVRKEAEMRINKQKKTMVRSQANTNATARALALRAILEG